MLSAAVDFQGFRGAQAEQADIDFAFGFQDEIEFFLAVAIKIHGPVRVVGSDGGFDFECARNLEKHFYVRIVVQSQSKGTLHGAAVVNDMIVDTVLDRYGILFQVGNKLFAVENFLNIIFLPGQFEIADAVHGQLMATIADNFHRALDEQLRIVAQVLQASALKQDFADRRSLGQGLFTDDGQHIRHVAVAVLDIRGPHSRFLMAYPG